MLNAGSLEGLASGTALQSRALEKQTSSIERLLEDPQERTRFINHLATGLANIIHTIDPDVIVIGGGVTGSADLYWEELLEAVSGLVYPSLRSSIDIRLATLKGHAGVIGAAYLRLIRHYPTDFYISKTSSFRDDRNQFFRSIGLKDPICYTT